MDGEGQQSVILTREGFVHYLVQYLVKSEYENIVLMREMNREDSSILEGLQITKAVAFSFCRIPTASTGVKFLVPRHRHLQNANKTLYLKESMEVLLVGTAIVQDHPSKRDVRQKSGIFIYRFDCVNNGLRTLHVSRGNSTNKTNIGLS